MNPCHHPDCPADVPIGLFGCRAHWFQLPRELRNEVNRTWRRRLAADSTNRVAAIAAHEAAKADAVAWWEAHR